MTFIDDIDTQKANRRFIQHSMSVPLLSREHEASLARRWRNEDDEAALHELVGAYSRLVISTASRFRNYGLPLGDLIQEGMVGLMQAAARFEPEREVRFSTYAGWWIRSAMQDFILRNWSIVRTGTTAAQKSLFFNLRRLRAKIEKVPDGRLSHQSKVLIAAELKVAVREVEDMENRLSGSDHSLNAPIGDEGDTDWQSLLRDDRPGPEIVALASRDGRTRSRWLAEAVSELSERERTIINERRLRDDSVTLEALGRELGISKERVRQIEHRALEKLRVCISRKVADPRDLFADLHS